MKIGHFLVDAVGSESFAVVPIPEKQLGWILTPERLPFRQPGTPADRPPLSFPRMRAKLRPAFRIQAWKGRAASQNAMIGRANSEGFLEGEWA